jgi:hypothetical protein
MLYQLPLNVALFILIINSILLVWLYLSWKWKRWQTVSMIVVFILFLVFSTLKLVSMAPNFAASTPNDVIFKSSNDIGNLFLARYGDKGLFVFWEERINGNESIITLEMEGVYPDGLVILKEIDGRRAELRPSLKTNDEASAHITVCVDDTEFKPVTTEGQIALKNYRKVAWANYASHILSLAFLTAFLVILFSKRGQNTSNF